MIENNVSSEVPKSAHLDMLAPQPLRKPKAFKIKLSIGIAKYIRKQRHLVRIHSTQLVGLSFLMSHIFL